MSAFAVLLIAWLVLVVALGVALWNNFRLLRIVRRQREQAAKALASAIVREARR